MIGTVGSMAGALTLYPMGKLFFGGCVIWFFTLFDMADGSMARQRGGGTKFGAVLDATCDRISDGAVFWGCCGGSRSTCATCRWWWRP